jgi:hypothetical protein
MACVARAAQALLGRGQTAGRVDVPGAWSGLLCCLPSIITASFNLFARVHLTTHWAIPAWFALPVLLAVWLLPGVGEEFAWKRFERGLAV